RRLSGAERSGAAVCGARREPRERGERCAGREVERGAERRSGELLSHPKHLDPVHSPLMESKLNIMAMAWNQRWRDGERDGAREAEMEGWREGGRDGGREKGRERGRDGGRHGGRKGEREREREGERDGGMERGRGGWGGVR